MPNGTLHFPDIYSGDAGIRFQSSYLVIAKATQGDWYVNPEYLKFKANAVLWKVFFTAYHFMERGDGRLQARHAFQIVGPHVPLMLDAELNTPTNSGPNLQEITDFIDEYKSLGGMVFLLYLPYWYWRDHLGSPSLASLKAKGIHLHSSLYGYQYSDNGPGWVSYGDLDVAVWQYSDQIAYGGMKAVDFNAFKGSGTKDVHGTLDEFISLVTTGTLASKEPTPPKPTVPQDHKTYTVQVGDNLTVIAAKFGTTWQALYDKNKSMIGDDPNYIRAGMVLEVP